MGMCLEEFGNVSIEVRRESFVIHPDYGERKVSSAFHNHWRESEHPEFLLEDLDDLIKALEDARDYLKNRR